MTEESFKEHRSEAVRRSTGAFCRVLLEEILPPIREAARGHGYAVAVHGTLARDIDLIAVAWREHNVSDPEDLVMSIVGVVAGVTGRCHRMAGSTEKPHGRKAYTLIHGGFIGEIDLSVIPPCPAPDPTSSKTTA